MPVYLLSDDLTFPHPSLATQEGLLAVGGDLSPERLLLAYANGIFPWYSKNDPILWWSPNPRLVLYLDQLRISRTLARTLRGGKFRITMDTRFHDLISACAQTRHPKREATWITPQMARAYIALHKLGYAHSVETWFKGEIVGGLYGVSLGKCFFGESMFSTLGDASKVALVHLRDFLRQHNFDLIDCQTRSDHLISLGAREVAREDFLAQLARSLKRSTLMGPWRLPSSESMQPLSPLPK